MDKQTFITTLVKQAGFTQADAEKNYAFLAARGWSADELATQADILIKSHDGTFAREDAVIEAFTYRMNGGR